MNQKYKYLFYVKEYLPPSGDDSELVWFLEAAI